MSKSNLAVKREDYISCRDVSDDDNDVGLAPLSCSDAVQCHAIAMQRGYRKSRKATLERSRTPVRSEQSPLQNSAVKVCLRDKWSAARVNEEESRQRLDADVTPETHLRLLRITDKHAKAGAELLAFADEVLVTPDAVLEDVARQCCVWSFSIR